MFAEVKDTNVVGTCIGVHVLGVMRLYNDPTNGKFYTVEMINGMCGTERKVTWHDVPHDGCTVTVSGNEYNVRLGRKPYQHRV